MTELFRLATEGTQHFVLRGRGTVVMEDHEQQYDPEKLAD